MASTKSIILPTIPGEMDWLSASTTLWLHVSQDGETIWKRLESVYFIHIVCILSEPTTIYISPFFLLYGRDPRLLVEKVLTPLKMKTRAQGVWFWLGMQIWESECQESPKEAERNDPQILLLKSESSYSSLQKRLVRSGSHFTVLIESLNWELIVLTSAKWTNHKKNPLL